MKTKGKSADQGNPDINRLSKNQRVFIELHDYSYYHSPSDIEDSDKRFIGRERLIEKFRSVLTDTTKKSGTYLVAGYRGMGKTSFVNKVLETIYTPSKTAGIIYNWALIVFAFTLLTIGLTIFFEKIFSNDFLNINIFYRGFLIIIPIFLIGLLSFLYKDRVYNNPRRFIDRFLLSEHLFQNRKSSKYLYLVLLYCFTFLLTVFVLVRNGSPDGNCYIIQNNAESNSLSIDGISKILSIYFWIFIAISLIEILAELIRIGRINGKDRKVKSFARQVKNRITSFINYSNRINIKLNLGYAELKERDILRLIARNIRTSYAKYQRSISTGILLRIVFFIAAYMMVKTVYEIKTFSGFNSTLRYNTGMTMMFPSQNDLYLNTDDYILGNMIDTLKTAGGFSLADYQVCAQMLNDYYKKDPKMPDFADKKELYSFKTAYLFAFFHAGNMDSLTVDSFDNKFISKMKLYFSMKEAIIKSGLYNKKAGINMLLETPFRDTAQFRTILKDYHDLTMSEMYNLILFWKECPDAFEYFDTRKLSVALLLELKKMNDIRDHFNGLKPLKKRLIVVMNYTDYAFYSGYHYFRKIFTIKTNKIIPYSIDYLFLIYLFLFLFIIRKASVILNFRFPSRYRVMKKIDFLNDLIDANIAIKTEQGISLPKNSVLFSRSKNKEYKQVDEREIEKYLIEIINDIAYRPLYSFRAQFVFVFDELDKIEPRYDTHEKENGKTDTGIYDATRMRQHAILELLSNLKYFLSTAQAKFIFITGREMYDASLADISDRNFRIGSIFHDIFYLNSFFTDLCYFGFDDITSRTEQFVCQFLFPKDYHAKEKTLKCYNQYLIEEVDGFNKKEEGLEDDEWIFARQKREKVIHLLQQFIIYLNHVSTGAPSKLTSYFENYIITKNQVQHFSESSIMAGDPDSENLFLFFDYYHQYKLGVINYLLTPFNFSINRNIRNYSDKLVVSASFLHDHLLKFHRNAFSWRDLEATPEMVDVNKNPELREFLENVIQFMLDTQIQRIVNGLYDFKFPKRISEEISYLSHVSEDASASFNFTLDESLAIKQHFRDQYLSIRQSHGNSPKDDGGYIFSLSSLNLTLADLCFYDEDLGEAITFYLEAVQSIRNLSVPAISLTQVALLTRNMLKLGHALEKRHTYDVAYLTYAEISNGIQKIVEATPFNIKDWLKGLLENVQFFYQPVLAALYLTEKISFNGITDDDIIKADENFLKIIGPLSNKNKPHLIAEYNKKVGDILYYKNYKSIATCLQYCPLFGNKKCGTNSICPACSRYNFALRVLVIGIAEDHNITDAITYIENKEVSRLFDIIRDKKIRLSASEYAALAIVISDIGDTVLSCLYDLSKNDKPYNRNILYENLIVFASAFDYFEYSAYFFRCAGDHKGYAFQHIKKLYLHREILILQNDIRYNLKEEILPITRRAISGMYTAYEQIHVYEISRFKNIFNDDSYGLFSPDISLNRISLNSEIDEITVLIQEIKLLITPQGTDRDNIVKEINLFVNPYTLNTNMYNRYLKLRLKALANELSFKELLGCQINVSVGNNTVFSNYVDFYSKQEKKERVNDVEFYITDTLFCYFEIIKILNTFDSSFSLNHTLQCETHEKLYIWSIYFNVYLILYDIKQSKKNEKNEKIDKQTILTYKTRDGIEVNDEILDKIRGMEHKFGNLMDKLGTLIEPDNLSFISHLFQGEKALREYYAAVETHNQGKAFKSLIEKMYYLNDDYNDRLFHFSIALERYKLSTVKIKETMESLKGIIINTDAYNIKNYLTTNSG